MAFGICVANERAWCAPSPPGATNSSFHLLDLSRFYTYSFTNLSTNRPWAAIPRGRQTNDGVPFQIGGTVELAGMDDARRGIFHPTELEGILAGFKSQRLHFLHGTAHSQKEGLPLASVRLHYTNGETRSLRLAYGVHSRGWIKPSTERDPDLEDPNSKLVWTITANESNQFTGTLRFFKTSVDNPLPDQQITGIDLVSLFGAATPLFFAVTAEESPTPLVPLSPLPRRKSLEHAFEFDDSAYIQELALKVVDAQSANPITNAAAILNLADDQSSFFFGEKSTDSSGKIVFHYPSQDAVGFKVQIKANAHAPELLSASRLAGTALPRELTAKLVPGVSIGGFVKDPAGKPVASAEVLVYRLTKTAPAEYTRIDLDSATTDSGGKWEVARVPADNSNLVFSVSCPDYKPATYAESVASATNALQVARSNLLAKTAVLIIQSGIHITGTVLDTTNGLVPLAEAIFETSDHSYRRAIPVEAGKFTFVEMEPRSGELLITATNYAPQLLALKIQPAIEPLKIVLTRGTPLQVTLRDQDQEPVPGASVLLEEWNQSHALNWKAETDSNGRFVWTNAPSGSAKFEISRSDYTSLRTNVTLSSTNEVTLHMRKHSRVAGAVLDADTRRPVEDFIIVKGLSDSPSDPLRWRRSDARRGKRGEYSLWLGDLARGDLRIMIEAPGYLPVVSDSLKKAGIYTKDFALKRGKGPVGTVQKTDGSPVNGATLVLLDKTETAQLQLGGYLQKQTYASFAQTDSAGRFELKPRVDADLMIASHPKAGYSQLALTNFSNGGKIVLQPWGCVKGSATTGTNGSLRELALLESSSSATNRAAPVLAFSARTRADKRGNFLFERVPPGEAKLSIELKPPGAKTAPVPLIQTNLLIKPGETNEFSLPSK